MQEKKIRNDRLYKEIVGIYFYLNNINTSNKNILKMEILNSEDSKIRKIKKFLRVKIKNKEITEYLIKNIKYLESTRRKKCKL